LLLLLLLLFVCCLCSGDGTVAMSLIGAHPKANVTSVSVSGSLQKKQGVANAPTARNHTHAQRDACEELLSLCQASANCSSNQLSCVTVFARVGGLAFGLKKRVMLYFYSLLFKILLLVVVSISSVCHCGQPLLFSGIFLALRKEGKSLVCKAQQRKGLVQRRRQR
jgi:hypothetical protein